MRIAFQLTSSHGGWRIGWKNLTTRYIFQLTSSHGGWQKNIRKWGYRDVFSTHILTWRMTERTHMIKFLSDFQLTSSHGGWHGTISFADFPCFFNSHPHMEDDQQWFPPDAGASFFNSHPHMEDDRQKYHENNCSNFSTHILTRRMTLTKAVDDGTIAFQLTSSQGGWHFRPYPKILQSQFSTHILTWRMTLR